MNSKRSPNRNRSSPRKLEPCNMCDNARVNSSLRDDNDLSYHTVGDSGKGYRIMIGAGDGKPVRILFETWSGDHWSTAGVYHPAHCPNCGRELIEYQKGGQTDEKQVFYSQDG